MWLPRDAQYKFNPISIVIEKIMDSVIGDHTLGISNLFCIDIKGNLLHEFISNPNGHALSQTYPIRMSYALGMECMIYPNGRLLHQSGKVIFSFKATTNIAQYEEIRYYVHIRCRELKFEWKQVVIDRVDIDNQLLIKECMYRQYNALTFDVYVEMINVRYVGVQNFEIFHQNQYFMEPFRIIRCIENEWIIDKQLLSLIAKCKKNQHFFSPNFEKNCFSMYCVPSKEVFGLKVYRIPHDVDYLNARISLAIYSKGSHNKCRYLVNNCKLEIGNDVDFKCGEVFDDEFIASSSSLTVMMRIDITK